MGKKKVTAANRVLVGDCIELMQGMSAGSVDLIFADPPYNIGYKYDQYEDKREDMDYIQWTQEWIDACARILTPGGSMYILIGDEYAAETRLHLKTLERGGKLAFRNWIIWHYTFGQNCQAKFNRSHAHLFYVVGSAAFEKKQAGFGWTFNRRAIAVPSARQTTYADKRANPTGKLPDDTWYLRPQEAEAENKQEPGSGENYFDAQGDTWYLSRLCGTFKERQGWHPCQLPEALLERIIKVSSNENEVVFDPFVGSGTTLAVAARLGRKWLGCEMSKEYAEKAQARAEHAKKTGQAMLTTCKEKGLDRSRPKKKPEPYRSLDLFEG